jgi:hypothetical protein
VGLERGPLNLVKINEELLERKNNCSALEARLTFVGECCADKATPLYPQKLSLQFADQHRLLIRYTHSVA